MISMSKEFNETSGYIAVLHDTTIPGEIILGDGKKYRSEFKQAKYLSTFLRDFRILSKN